MEQILRLLEYIPTSYDLERYRRRLPSFPVIKLTVDNASLRFCFLCGRRSSGTFYRWTNELITQVVKNKHQSVAICFLFALAVCFLHESSHSSMYKPSGGLIREITVKTIQDRIKGGAHAPEIPLPTIYNYLTSTNHSNPLTTVPIMVYLPRSGGNTIAQIMGQCEGMILGGVWTGGKVESLNIVHQLGVKQVTADFSTKVGRETARDQGIKEVHNLLVLTQNIVDSADLFSGSFQAELWVWVRHPIERQISTYYYQQSLRPGHPHYDANVLLYSLGDWAQTALHTPNAMMHAILGQPRSPVGFTTTDLIVAKNVLRQKAKIGLLEQKAESIRRYLKGRHVGASGGRECKERLLDYAWQTINHHPNVHPNSEEYNLLMQRNSWDMLLWEYLQYLFQVQGGAVLEEDDDNSRHDQGDDSE